MVLKSLEPVVLELSLKACEDLEAERKKLDHQWKQRIERAEYTADRMYRQYNQVEPENRLVVRTLEKQWEQALLERNQLQTEYETFQRTQPTQLTEADRNSIRSLAQNIPELWHADSTTIQEKKQIVRQLIEKVVLTILDNSEKVQVQIQIQWIGDHYTEDTIQRLLKDYNQLSTFPQLLDRIKTLQVQQFSAKEIAEQLNEESWRSVKTHRPFTAERVRTLISCNKLSKVDRKKSPSLPPGQYRAMELARELGIPEPIFYSWIKKGKIKALQPDGKQGNWIVEADEQEKNRIKKMRLDFTNKKK
jgi:hypothetical protein